MVEDTQKTGEKIVPDGTLAGPMVVGGNLWGISLSVVAGFAGNTMMSEREKDSE
ncbi:hypothetical protein [Marinobacter fuscus]|uniref:hypothetical protein n=1 Tax=Marinobacter fuscus TaxID=2109942 RepID=UPI0013FDB50D|nr:hypothetical protein [Marinobacter fuscus]